MVGRQSRPRINVVGAPDTIRTCGLHLRRVALYPAELRVHLLLTQCLRGFLVGVQRSTPVPQVSEFKTSFKLLYCTNRVDTSLRRAAVCRVQASKADKDVSALSAMDWGPICHDRQ